MIGDFRTKCFWGSGDFSYSWDDGSTDSTNEITFDLAMEMFNNLLTITDNCTLESSSSSIQVSLTQLPLINIDSPQYTACNNDLVTLEPNVSVLETFHILGMMVQSYQ